MIRYGRNGRVGGCSERLPRSGSLVAAAVSAEVVLLAPRPAPSTPRSSPCWRPSCPAAAAHLDEAREDILAFTAFPCEVWRRIWSNTRRSG